MLKIVISPAKKMNITDEFPCNATVPVFSDRADVLHGILKNKNIQELKTLWKCSDKLAEQSYQRLHAFSPDQAVTPALLAYEGIQYQHIAPSVFYRCPVALCKCSPSHFIRILRNLKTDRQSYSLSFGNAGKVRNC